MAYVKKKPTNESTQETVTQEGVQTPKVQEPQTFQTVDPSSVLYDILCGGVTLKGYYAPNKRGVRWFVPGHLVERFKNYCLVKEGRIVSLDQLPDAMK